LYVLSLPLSLLFYGRADKSGKERSMGISQDEISGMANVACAWLAYRSTLGFERTLSEAMLSVPITEYLSARTNWKLTPELSYRNLPGDKALPNFWTDFAGENKYGAGVSWILETKYLKQKAENMANHIAADIVRLSLPSHTKVKRLFLLAGEGDHFPKTKVSCLFGRLYGLERKRGCMLKMGDATDNHSFLKSYPAFEQMKEDGQQFLIPSLAYIECRSIQEVHIAQNRTFKVMVWSVARAKSSATALAK
jgi:hypothetical protein